MEWEAHLFRLFLDKCVVGVRAGKALNKVTEHYKGDGENGYPHTLGGLGGWWVWVWWGW